MTCFYFHHGGPLADSLIANSTLSPFNEPLQYPHQLVFRSTSSRKFFIFFSERLLFFPSAIRSWVSDFVQNTLVAEYFLSVAIRSRAMLVS